MHWTLSTCFFLMFLEMDVSFYLSRFLLKLEIVPKILLLKFTKKIDETLLLCMGIIRNFRITILIYTAALVLAGCWRQEKCERFYEFESHYTLSPAQDTFYVGDTIWIEAEYSSKHLDLISGEQFDFDGINPKIDFYLAKIDQNPYIQNYEDFEISSTIGDLSFFELIGVSGFRLVHRYEMGSYSIKFWYIPQKAGLYYSGLSSYYIGDLGDGPDINLDSLCDDYINSYSVILNDHEGTNFDFLARSEDDAWHKVTQEDFDIEGGYCFYVVE